MILYICNMLASGALEKTCIKAPPTIGSRILET